MNKIFDNISWELLREQKQTLLEMEDRHGLSKREKETILGMVNLLDALQDTAVDELGFPEATVFGTLTAEE